MVAPTVTISDNKHSTAYSPVETVERKGIGHPDSMCDGFGEACSRAISKAYIEEFGTILHHNLDKSLLVCADDDVAYEFGDPRKLVKPIRYIQSGRVTPLSEDFGETLEILREAILDYGQTFKYLDVDDPTQFLIDFEVGKGSAELAGNASTYKTPLAGDSSFGCGFAPRTPLEELVYTTERLINSEPFMEKFPTGQDVKVMGSRTNGTLNLTCAIAMIQSKIKSGSEYQRVEKELTQELIEHAENLLGNYNRKFELDLQVNAAGYWPTVTGLCCERADEGQIGRGNRVSGLITPSRRSSMEAAAGKNPYNHVGKLYNIGADVIANAVYNEFSDRVNDVQTVLTSRIGKPITEPKFFSVEVHTGLPNSNLRGDIEGFVGDMFNDKFFQQLTQDIVDGKLSVF